MSGFASTTSGSRWLRRCSNFLGSGVSKGACPFRWKSKNQEVFGVLFVKLSSHKKVSAGVGRVGPQCASQEPSCKSTSGAGCVSPQSSLQKVRRRKLRFLLIPEKAVARAKLPALHFTGNANCVQLQAGAKRKRKDRSRFGFGLYKKRFDY